MATDHMPAPHIVVRDATAADRDFALATSRRLAAFGPPRWRTSDEIVASERRVLDRFFGGPEAGTAVLVAEGPAGPVGFAYLETLHDYFTGESHGHVGMVAVVEGNEGVGVARALMRAAEDWARRCGFRRLTLNVFEANHRARILYERLGYEAETRRYVKLLAEEPRR